MMKLLAFLWSGCWHDWRPTGIRIAVFDFDWSPRPSHEKHEYRCEHCNRIRQWRA